MVTGVFSPLCPQHGEVLVSPAAGRPSRDCAGCGAAAKPGQGRQVQRGQCRPRRVGRGALPVLPAPVATTAHGGLSRRRREGRGGPEPWHLAPAQWGPPSVSHLGPRYRTGGAGWSAAETQVWVKCQRPADPVQAEAEPQRWRARVRRAGASGPLRVLQSPPAAWGSRHLQLPEGSL